jgi:hypothetical protein
MQAAPKLQENSNHCAHKAREGRWRATTGPCKILSRMNYAAMWCACNVIRIWIWRVSFPGRLLAAELGTMLLIGRRTDEGLSEACGSSRCAFETPNAFRWAPAAFLKLLGSRPGSELHIPDKTLTRDVAWSERLLGWRRVGLSYSEVFSAIWLRWTTS